MRTRFYHSLRFKVQVGLSCVLVAILALIFSLHYADSRRVMLENLKLSAVNAGEIVEGSLQHAMLTNDFSEVQQIVDNIAEQQGVAGVLLLDKAGKVLIASSHAAIGTVIDASDPTCEACHQYAATSRNESVIFRADGTRYYRNVNAIENGPACQACHDPALTLSGVLITDLSMTDVDAQLASIRNSSILWSSVSIVVLMVVLDLLMNQMVLNKLSNFLDVIKGISKGHFGQRVQVQSRDEIGQLASVFNAMADGLQEKDLLEHKLKAQTEELRAQAERLSALNAVALAVSQSLDLNTILESALSKVLELLGWDIGWVVLHDEQGDGHSLGAVRGLPADVVVANEGCTWDQEVCSKAMGQGGPHVVAFVEGQACPAANATPETHPAFRICIPLRTKGHLRGVMTVFATSAYSTEPPSEETIELLGAIGRQIGIAVENAELYQELSRKEALRKQLLARILTAQEEERKRISRELHDETSQALTSLLVNLKLLGEAKTLDEAQRSINKLRAEVAQTLEEVHGLALGLRPTILDDLGLVAALRHFLKDYQQRFRLLADLQVLGLEDQRLPADMETVLYHIVQEALTNVARHSGAQNVSVVLQVRDSAVIVIVEDDGKGFDVTQVMGSKLAKQNLGLYGMQERASLLGGKVTIESTPGTGTTVYVEMPLEQENGIHELNQDSAALSR